MRELAIIILQHNTPDHVSANLKALQEAEIPADTKIIVVDNGGKQGNEKIIKENYKNLDVEFYETANDGFPAGNNFGYKKAGEAHYYAFINPDIVVKKDTIKNLLSYMKNHPKVGIVSPQLRYRDGSVQDNYRTFPRIPDLIIKRIPFLRKRFPNRMRNYLMWDRDPGTNQAVDWVTGAFIIVSNPCMKAIGKHDDDHYFLFMSDVVICRDAWEKGFETHIVGKVECLHNDTRLSSGGIKDVFKKRIIRLHIKDAISYFWHYKFSRLPENAPSVSRLNRRERVMKAHKLSGRSHLIAVDKKLQKENPVVTVYQGEIEGSFSYKQPVVHFADSAVALIINEKNEVGLIKVWRHTPLNFNTKNTFPIFPAADNLGIWSYEAVRGGLEKIDTLAIEAAKRELKEEVGLEEKAIKSIEEMGIIIGNTAIDVYRHTAFKVQIDSTKFRPTPNLEEGIKELKFFKISELKDLIKKKELVCSMTQAIILQTIIYDGKEE